MTPLFHIDLLRAFSADEQVYRAFGYLVASRMGTLLLVPFHLVTGRCDDVVDGCPVPWEEVFSVLEYPRQHIYTALIQDDLIEQLIHLGIDVADCELDTIAPMVNGPEKVLRLMHPCGVRYAVVMP